MSKNSRNELIYMVVKELASQFLSKNPGFERKEIEKRYRFALSRDSTRKDIKKNLMRTRQKTTNLETKTICTNLLHLIEIIYGD